MAQKKLVEMAVVAVGSLDQKPASKKTAAGEKGGTINGCCCLTSNSRRRVHSIMSKTWQNEIES